MLDERKRKIPLLPLRGVVVFPNMITHLDIGRDKSVKAVEEAMLKDKKIFLVCQKETETQEPSLEDLFEVGTIAEIKHVVDLPGGTLRVLIEGEARASLLDYVEGDFVLANVSIFEDKFELDDELEALFRVSKSSFEEFGESSKRILPEVLFGINNIDDPSSFLNTISSHLDLEMKEKQEILETFDLKARFKKVYGFLMREIEILDIEHKISEKIRAQMEKGQKDYYLREQMKAIQEELGEDDERVSEASEYREKILALNLPEDVSEKILKEIDRMEKMPAMMAEPTVIRTYLDWILELPWNKTTEDSLDLDLAEKILDEDHYGLRKAKERILEYLAVKRLSDKMQGPIICLVGPPGVGKTSLAKSIARAMKREFVRVSLGGVRDEAEIRGHRRTYVGSMPGRIIKGMRSAGSLNPVFLLDEIDKMSMEFRGDPSAALLEVLDPEQNDAFYDHYLEIDFDLSKVLFITTANTLYNIPRPLLDRMEIIHLSSYTEEEKMKIAENYLLPRQLERHGLDEEKCQISLASIQKIIRHYTRESGVRNLERKIADLCRKSAKMIVEEPEKSVRVNVNSLEKYLGPEQFSYGTTEKENELGVATGLAWTEVGGDILQIEVSVLEGKGKLILTGKLGDVMKESAQTGVTYVRSRIEELKLPKDFHEKYDIHIHVPEGAIPKDGPSAGITMATALVSALSKKEVRKDVAMTGEVTLRGRVLPIGGVKEKVLAAHRAGSKTIILPKENEKDLQEIRNNIRNDLEFVFVEHMDEVLKTALVEG